MTGHDQILWLCDGFIVLPLIPQLMKRRYVSGTRGRYVWASVWKATNVAAVIALTVGAVTNLVAGGSHVVWGVIWAACAGWNAYFTWREWGDDDDFWTKTGKRIRGWFRNRRRVSLLKPVVNTN